MTNPESREHLSVALTEVPAGSRLTEFDNDNPAPTSEHSLSWLAHRFVATPDDPIDRVRAMGIIAARQYDEDLTYSTELKEQYQAIENRLEGQAGEVVTILNVYNSDHVQDDNTEGVFCYTGILPDVLAYQNEPRQTSISAPGAIGFRLFRTPGDMVDLGGIGKDDVLPLVINSDRYSDHTLLPAVELTNTDAHRNVAHIVTSDELSDKLTDLFSSEMAAELALQIATAIYSQQPDKLPGLFNKSEVLSEQFSAIKEILSDHKEFYRGVMQANAVLIGRSPTIFALPAQYAAQRRTLFESDQALLAKHRDRMFDTVATRQVRFEKTRTWPFMDIDADSVRVAERGNGLNSDYIQREIIRESKEMGSRIERANENLAVINAVLNN